MRVGLFFFGGVEIDDAGAGPPAPTSRRYEQKHFWHAQERLLDMGVRAEELGYDSYWLTEHHFQYEGYEVVPNGILFGAFLAERTSRIRIGTMFNIIGQWHPLRLAEDFATLHNLSGGRGILGVGRGTVPREIQPLSGNRVSIGSFDNPDMADADRINREITDESIEIIKLAFENETFSFKGKYFELPPPGIPDRGGFVETLTLIPRPKYPYEIWQAITSPPTLEHAPTLSHGGVFWNQNHRFIKRFFDRYGEVWAESHDGAELGPGEKRMLVLNVRVEDTYEEALDSARPGHDEFWKFLGPYGWSRGYAGDDGKPVAPGLIPTLENSLGQKTWVVGTPEQVAEGIAFYKDLLGLQDLVLFPNFSGDTYEKTDEQMTRLAEEVLPLVK
ncbi:MAG TPA: LLM class flavin-dependent oxidoreductase [Acidimicrobiales bacterium]|nr:LLM class flavin-dependent oxidoreductase [Acidimicrobiales bacterium]